MNKPLKRNQHIISLSKDHHFTLLFCWKIRQGIKHGAETSRIIKYVHYFWENDMKEHFREEEEILFSAVQDDKVAKAINDHRQIEQQLKNLSNNLSVEETRQHLLSLAGMVDNHVRYEERELFPHLETVLSEEQLEAIGTQLKKDAAPKDDYPDAFWMQS